MYVKPYIVTHSSPAYRIDRDELRNSERKLLSEIKVKIFLNNSISGIMKAFIKSGWIQLNLIFGILMFFKLSFKSQFYLVCTHSQSQPKEAGEEVKAPLPPLPLCRSATDPNKLSHKLAHRLFDQKDQQVVSCRLVFIVISL